MQRAGSQGVPRRAVLERGLLGGLFLALFTPGCETGCQHASAESARDGSLDEHDRQIVLALARRVVRVPAAWPSVEQVDVVGRAERQMALMAPALRRELRSLLRLFDGGTLAWVLDRQARRFTDLTPDGQDRVLHAWQTSHLRLRRTGVALLRDLCAGNYYSARELWPHLGYPGPPEQFHDAAAPVFRGVGAP